MYSQIALKIYSAISENIIKSNANFWKDYFSLDKMQSLDVDTKKYEDMLKTKDYNLTCVFDDSFPKFQEKLKNSEKPFLFAYKGDLKLLNNIENNIAVIGTLYPTEDIMQREKKVVKECVENNFNIVSGLADGCDTVAHTACIENFGKTIAFLPTTLDNIYPTKNTELAQNIIDKGGLVITEYVLEAKNKYERIKRFIDRDRLQAMFASSIILIASFRQGEGDSGSRHAMQKAKIYGRKRFVMFNEKTDKNKAIFALNEDLIKEEVNVLTHNSIKELVSK